ncbi:hypothetical protein halTADL_1731 [Halohasta litchfieldiae]|jgi:hypothetical protein|uniref:Uncharacterized protein n=1 Tax=Halohasta litchfieldiae TaxID=1073996 RepID=A0A1H6RBF0_9EURY|nr:hypothetical protein [Halohasta litchfieldiae]ATW88485.1 hypothetical protein halTADL_1731 [Halohasta litchfieldiae]SEI49857.1 hypothetical protein SAMN05444271_101234 [Halohasta litchfieldiae]
MVATLVSTPLQASPSPLAVIGTVGLLALFLALTAHLAARNVVGDVSASKALGVGLGPAVVSLLTQLLPIPGGIGVLVALAVDGIAIDYLYDQPRRTSLRILAVHTIVTVLLGTVLIGGLILVMSIPG